MSRLPEAVTTWTCGSCGKTTDGRSGLDDAMDCFCPRCPRCGGLTDGPADGEECICDMGDDARACANCGCTDERACDGGCWWVAEDLCSACQPQPESENR